MTNVKVVQPTNHKETGQKLYVPAIATGDIKKQEAHGPRVTHLSGIASADMQMLCNIFPILSSQLNILSRSMRKP